MTSVLGIDHIYLSVSDLAAAQRWYDAVFRVLGFRKEVEPIDGEPHVHYVSPRVQVTLRSARTRSQHDPYAPGLHHLCFQVAERQDVEDIAARLHELGVEATEPRLYPQYNPEYFATFFRDPDGLRLEVVARTAYRERLLREWKE